jgi:hypothetical protein
VFRHFPRRIICAHPKPSHQRDCCASSAEHSAARFHRRPCILLRANLRKAAALFVVHKQVCASLSLASTAICLQNNQTGGVVVIRCLRTVGRESPTERESALMLSPETKCRRRISAINSIFITKGSPDYDPDLITTKWKLLNAVSAQNLETFAR